ncbi:fibronectin type III domain-containing protein [Sodalis ligni]|uniref:fibronectin type III domain-containing protein n=1 Tax=Sodalis ligni TaxID=2697027 RepID=UPI00193F6A2C
MTNKDYPCNGRPFANPPAKPENFRIIERGQNFVQVQWTAGQYGAPVYSYSVFVSAPAGAGYPRIVTAAYQNATYANVSGLLPNVTYYFYVVATGYDGLFSPLSDPLQVVATLPIPSQPPYCWPHPHPQPRPRPPYNPPNPGCCPPPRPPYNPPNPGGYPPPRPPYNPPNPGCCPPPRPPYNPPNPGCYPPPRPPYNPPNPGCCPPPRPPYNPPNPGCCDHDGRGY